MNDVYYSSLIGRTVQIYKGGPYSNTGTLCDVNGDYLALQTNDGQIIYYKTSHIKSITDKTQNQYYYSAQSSGEEEDENSEVTLYTGHSFNDLACQMKGCEIRINGKGPESKVGKLVDVKSDFLLIYDKKDGLVFFNENHIKCLSLAESTETEDENKEENENHEEKAADHEADSSIEHWNALMELYDQFCDEDIHSTCKKLKYSAIKINQKGPESMQGLLVDIHDDHLVMVVKEEIYRIALYHVKSFSVNISITQQENEEKQDSQEANNSNANSNNNNSNDSNQEDNSNNGNYHQSYQQHLNRMMRIKRKRVKARQQNQGN